MRIFYFMLIACYCIACNQTESTTAAKSDSTTVATSEEKVEKRVNWISFKVDDKIVETKPFAASLVRMEGHSLINVLSDKRTKAQTINVTFNVDFPKVSIGKYQVLDSYKAMSTPQSCFGSYTADAQNNETDVYSFIEGSMTIESYNLGTGEFNATFSGKAKNINGDEVNITEGKMVNVLVK